MPRGFGRGRRALLGVVCAGLVAVPAAAAARYTVRPGDTLTGIASRYRTSVATLARLNGLDPDGVLLIGTRLRIPERPRPTIRYRVEPGDTLTGIAERFGTTVAALARLNRIDPDDVLLIGTRLRVPAGRRANASSMTPDEIRAALDFWAGRHGVDPALVRALAWQESGYQTHVVSSAGAFGVMQVTPDTWSFVEEVLLGYRLRRTAGANIRIGVAFLAHLLREFHGSERLALAAYYQGPRSVRRRGLLGETRRYVANVLALRGRV